jgi:hypothetical protein
MRPFPFIHSLICIDHNSKTMFFPILHLSIVCGLPILLYLQVR